MSGLAAWWSLYWQFVLGVILGGVLGFLANWFFYRKGRRSKRLSWELLSKNRIIQASDSARKNLTVSFNGAEVKDPNILVIRIGNTGTEEVRADAFGPDAIRIDFGPANLLVLDVVGRSDPEIRDERLIKRLVQNRRNLVYVPAYLNPGEWLDFQFITDGKLKDPETQCKFAGQTHPFERLDKVPTPSRRILFFHLTLFGLMLVSILISGIFDGLGITPWDAVFGLIGVSLLMLFVINALSDAWRRRALRWKEARPAISKPVAEADEEKSTVASVK